jgi:hypothetical protein
VPDRVELPVKRILFCVGVLIAWSVGWGAAAIVGSVTNLSTGSTCTPGAGTNRILVLAIGGRTSSTASSLNPTVTALSVGSASIANGQVIEASTAGIGSAANSRAAIYYVREANIGVGAQTVSITWSQTMGATSRISCYTLSGVAQTGTVESISTYTTASSTDPWSSSLAVTAGSFQVLSAVAGGGGVTAVPGAGWTEDDDFSNGNTRKYAQSLASASAGSVTWTVDKSAASTGAVAVASFAAAMPPVFSGTVAAQSYVEDSPISPLNLATFFSGTVTSYAVQSGTLPTGLSLNTSTGVISGTPTTPAGATAIVVRATNSDGTADTNSFNITITAAASAPAFTVQPTVSSETETAFTLSYTASASSTFYAVACLKDSTAPTISQVKAGDCTGGVDALAAVSEAVTGADTTVLGGSLDDPLYDIYAVLNNGSGDSGLATLVDKWLDAPAGYQYTLLTSIAANGWVADVNAAGASPAIAVGNVVKIVTTSDPTGCPVTQEADGNATLGSVESPCTSARQLTLYGVWRSDGTWMTPNPANLWWNNQGLTAPIPGSVRFYMRLNQPVSVDLTELCTSPHGDLPVYGTDEAMPDGLDVTGQLLTGTPTEGGDFEQTWWCEDATGQRTEFR